MTEKRLLIDIFCLREAYRNGDLENLGWILTQLNVADALTKDPCPPRNSRDRARPWRSEASVERHTVLNFSERLLPAGLCDHYCTGKPVLDTIGEKYPSAEPWTDSMLRCVDCRSCTSEHLREHSSLTAHDFHGLWCTGTLDTLGTATFDPDIADLLKETMRYEMRKVK